MSRSLKFANTIAASLRHPRVVELPSEAYGAIGHLDIGPAYAKVIVRVPWLFNDLKRHGPIIWCDESWMKTGADWHNFPPMCWVLPDEWRDTMDWKGKPADAIIQEGCELAINNSRALIVKHWIAKEEGITEWPADWPFWGHGQEGVEQYKHEQRLRDLLGEAR